MSPNENGRLLGGRAAGKTQSKAQTDCPPAASAAQALSGRRAIITRLLSMCLVDTRYCGLMDRHRDGIVYRVPPLREIHDLERS